MSDQSVYIDLLQRIERSRLFHIQLEQSIVTKAFEDSLPPVMEVIKEALLLPDLLVHNDIHQACIHFDRERLAKSEKEREQFDNMLSENLSARNSITLLVEKPGEYRQGVEDAYAPYRKVLRPPAKEASLVAYKNISKQLGHLKRGASSKAVKNYFTARQDLLRSDLDLIAELQCKALGLEAPKKSNSVSLGKGLDLSR